jgi:hypothetical protein
MYLFSVKLAALCFSLLTNGWHYHAILSYTAKLSGCSGRVANTAHFEIEVKSFFA